jgi:HEAT repeat protein
MRITNTLMALGLSLLVSGASFAGGLDTDLLTLQSTGATYESGLSALVSDASLNSGALSDLASGHSDWRVRHQASVVLGWRSDAALFEQVSAMPPVTTRAGFPRFVGDWRGTPAASSALLDRLLHGGEDVATSKALVEAMIHTGGDFGAALSSLLPAQSSVELRVIMAAALRDAEGPAALTGLVDALSDADPEVREEAARSIGWRPDGADAADALVLACDDAHPDVRAAGARALGWLQVDRALDTLAGMLTDTDADVRLHALRGVSKIDPAAARALPGLSDLAQDSDHRVANLASKIAGQ